MSLTCDECGEDFDEEELDIAAVDDEENGTLCSWCNSEED
jgi:hypothetical protein